jgi:uncharacterized protein (DUF433 family)
MLPNEGAAPDGVTRRNVKPQEFRSAGAGRPPAAAERVDAVIAPRGLWYTSPMDYRPFITIEAGKRGGKPCVRGLRITVYDVLEYLASGMTEEEILSDFPDLTREDIRACLAFAADRERKLVKVPA